MRLSRNSVTALAAAASGMFAQSAIAQTGPAQMTQHCPDSYFVLRSDFNDLTPFACPTIDSHQQGATVSETNNALTGQNSAAFDGLAAYVYRIPSADQNITVGPYVQANVTYQFQPTPSQAWTSDTITSGVFTQFAIDHPTDKYFDYFRLRAGETDASIGSRSATFVGEWIPVYGEGIGLEKQFGIITVERSGNHGSVR
jgi:hypothetical protein